MIRNHLKGVMLVIGLALILVSGAAMAQTPASAIADVVANSGVFPFGTYVVSVTEGSNSIVVDLSAAAISYDFGDTQAEAYADALNGALAAWSGVPGVDITVAKKQLGYYLPKSTQPLGAIVGASQNALSWPLVTPQTTELSGKLIVLHPSHGSYVYGTSPTWTWYRAQRTFSGPNPVTNMPAGRTTNQPSDYYFWTRGFGWPMYYEDDMSPETIRFLYAYCQSAGAATYCSRDLNKLAGAFPATTYGYPATTYPRWQVAAKYALQDRGGVPATVYNTSDVTAQSDKDIRARPYYANWLKDTLGYAYNNCISFSLHSNAATTGSPAQSQARGTETYYPTNTTPWPEQANSAAFCQATETAVIRAIRSEYDGTWAEPIYNAATGGLPGPVPPEWVTAYGTYRGYKNGTTDTNARWQDRLVKNGTTAYGEIREARMPAQLMELLFHDDWKFYPDEAFHQDAIFRASVAWGMYSGFCTYFGVTPKTRNNATVDSVSFPAIVQPGQAFTGTVTMKNQGVAWCWGMKQVGTVYGPYTVWNLKGATTDQFGMSGTQIYIANDGYYYPGDTATFTVNLTAPPTGGNFTTNWRMARDGAGGGSFGSTASAVIGVDAPYFSATQNAANVKTNSATATTPVTLQGDVLITVAPSPANGFATTDPVTVTVDGVTTGAVTQSGANYVCTATVDSATANGTHLITITVTEADATVHTLTNWIYVNKNEINGTVTIPGFVGASRDVAFSIDGGTAFNKTLAFTGGTASYKLTNVSGSVLKLSAKTAWTLRQKKDVSLSSPVNFTLAGGDINGTNSINVADYNVLLLNWLKTTASADINGDGIVNATDYACMKMSWLQVGDAL